MASNCRIILPMVLSAGLFLLPAASTVEGQDIRLQSPADNATGISVNPSLVWQEALLVNTYRVELGTSPDFSDESLVVDQDNIRETVFQVEDLEHGQVYYWRVEGTGRRGYRPTSETWRFTTTSPSPSASTEEPQHVEESSAVLTGQVIPTALGAEVHFEWGPDGDLSNSTPPQSVPPAEEAVEVLATIDDLEAGEAYNYRVVASSAISTSTGTIRHFVTLPLPPVLSEPSPGALMTDSEAVVSWQTARGASGYHVQVALSDTFSEGDLVLDRGNVEQTSAQISNLLAGQPYYWRVRSQNESGSGRWSDLRSFRIYPEELTIQADWSFSDPSRSASYRMISLPGDVDLPLAEALEEIPTESWIAYLDNGQSDDAMLRYDGSNDFSFRPGNAYWVLSREPLSLSKSVDPVRISDTGTYTLELHEGWNMISNPFEIPVPWSSVMEMNDFSVALWGFNGNYYEASHLEPYEGYYFFNQRELEELIIPYTGDSPSGAEASSRIPDHAELTVYTRNDGTLSSSIRILSPEVGADEVTSGEPAPPHHFEEFSIRILDSRGETDNLRTAVTMGSDLQDVSIPVMISASERQSFRIAVSLPENMSSTGVFLRDDRTGRIYDLVSKPIYIDQTDKRKYYTLILGSAEFVREELGKGPPHGFSIFENYPNPFSRTTTIPYTLPERADIRIDAFDLLGRKVATVQAATLESGFHEAVWDGTDDSGTVLPSGTYLIRIATQYLSKTTKVQIVR